jgi:hypothetical protein
VSLRYALSILLVLGACIDLLAAGCGSNGTPPKAPCAAPIVALYTAEMLAAGCKGEHFDDPQCAAIKEQRDAREQEAGCK